MKVQQIHNWKVLRNVFDPIFCSLEPSFNTGKLMRRADGRMRQCDPVIWAQPAYFFENIHLCSIKQHHCAVCKAPKSSFGEGTSSLWQFRDYQPYFQKMILMAEGDKMHRWEAWQYLEDWVVGTSEGVFWNIQCIFLSTNIIPNILHTVYLGLLKHLMKWVTSCLEQRSRMVIFMLHLAKMLLYPGYTSFNKAYSQVTQ